MPTAMISCPEPRARAALWFLGSSRLLSLGLDRLLKQLPNDLDPRRNFRLLTALAFNKIENGALNSQPHVRACIV